MQYKYCFQGVHYMLYDICENLDKIFNGLSTILDGDFVQILSIIKNSNCAIIINTYIQKSTLWLRLNKLILRLDMKLQSDEIKVEFAKWLGKLSYDLALRGLISLPILILQKALFNDLYKQVFFKLCSNLFMQIQIFPLTITLDSIKQSYL